MAEQRARQAVVVVHGIGQQRPMSTLSGYVDGITDEDDLAFAAPDRVSDQRDLKRMKVTWLPPIERSAAEPAPPPPVSTDFYELYWANLVQGSELRHVTAWLGSLLPNWRRLGPRLKRFLRYHIGYGVVALFVALVTLVLSFVLPGTWDAERAILRWIGGAVIPAASGWIVWHLGDVPRYLHNVADNVSIQRAIRREGVTLLRNLHDMTYVGSTRPMYERIVVVGHSLGSVVAYDIVRDYWTDTNRFYGIGPATAQEIREAADAVELDGEALWMGPPSVAASSGDIGFSRFQAVQRALSARWQDTRSDPPGDETAARWAITDLVTLACPLTHADFLMASGPDAIAQAQWNRTLASCPPRRQLDRASYRFEYVRGRVGTQSWHQAAPFAPTRWTNVYYSSDVVGGPLQPLFGPGIVDIELEPPSGRRGRMPGVHSLYDATPEALGILRRIIWDGGTRAGAETILELRRDSLVRVVRDLVDSPHDVDAALTAAPLLSRLDEGQRHTVAGLVLRLRESPATDDEIGRLIDEGLSDVVPSVLVGAVSLPRVSDDPGEDDEWPGEEAWEEEEEEAFEEELEEELEEEEEPEEEEE